MSETAKQDTTKVPAAAPETGAAETGSAAPESAATPGQPDTSAQPQAGAESAPAAEAGEPAQPDLDETKRKFREALERKHQAHNESQGKGGRDGGKINGAHGPAASRRNFRRKSG
jgi:hypothetical protein